MENKTKVTLKYHSGGFGPTEIFFTEKLVVSINSIEYKKEWEANKKIIDNDSYFYSHFDKPDVSWKLKKPNGMYVQPLHELVSYLGYDLGNRMQFDMVCDGDWLDYEVITPEGEKIKNGFSICAYDEVRKKIVGYLLPFMPEEIPMPEFLKDYSEEE